MNGRPAKRRGSLLLDAAMATLVLSIAMAVVLQVLDRLSSQRRAADRHQFALQAASNALEELVARPWAALNAGPVNEPSVDPELAKVLPGARWERRVEESDAGLRKVIVAIYWRDKAGQAEASARLAAWVSKWGRAAQ